MRTREAALAALFARISTAYAWNNSPTRRLVLWDQSPQEQRPAFYQFEGGREVYKWTNGVLAARTIEARLFVYLDSSDHTIAGAMLMNSIMDAIDAAMAPTGAEIAFGKCTLGGTCDHARIDGEIITDPGDIDDDGLIMVPVRITLP